MLLNSPEMVELVLGPNEGCILNPRQDGTVSVHVPLESVKRAYCDSVAREVEARATTRSQSAVQ